MHRSALAPLASNAALDNVRPVSSPIAQGRHEPSAVDGSPRARNIATALVSNCTSDVRAALVEHGIDRWFDQIILSAEVGVMKPAPEIYARATDGLDIDPAACLYVGDGSDNELDGAANAGMRPVLYDPNESTGPDFITVTSHLDLLTYVDQ